jgi:Tol biopolymer transport system component
MRTMTGRRTLWLLGMALATTQAAATDEAAVEPEGDADPDWSVLEAPGAWRTVSIDVERFTWSDVDVSPDGRTLVFHTLGDLYRVPIDGGDAEALTADLAWNFQPTFSPDGRHIAFVSDRGGADNVWVMPADGGEPRAVTEEREHLLHNPAWSPDGAFIAARKGYHSRRSIPAGSLWLYHHSGGSGTEAVERLHGDESQKNIAEPAFSPDGAYLYFSQDITGGSVWQYNRDAIEGLFAIQRLDLATGEVTSLVSGPGGAVRPTPSPDGRRLAFVRRQARTLESQLVVRDLLSGRETVVDGTLDRDKQETSGDMGNYPRFSWLPNGEELVYWARGGFHRVGLNGDPQRIPVRLRADKRVHPAQRVAVPVAADDVPVRMQRWTQYSPDGRLAVSQALGYLWVHDLERGERRRLTRQTDHFEFHPSFSPDGRFVVFTTWSDDALGSVRIEPVGRGSGRVLTREPGHYVEPAFSPDGGSVAFRKITGGFLISPLYSERAGLYRVPADGSSEPVRVLDRGRTPRFSADGERLLYTDQENTRLGLMSVTLDGHDERRHYQGDWVTEWSVSPDGRWLAFVEHYDVWVMPFVGTGKALTVSGETKAFPVRRVSARAGSGLHWSADSTRLRWSHGARLYERRLADAFAFLDGAPETLPEPATEGRDLTFTVRADRPGGVVALVGGRIVTLRDAGDQQEVIEDGVVVIRGNRIDSVGSREDVAIPDGARRFDLDGQTVLPGLIDVHAHGAMSREQLQPRQNWMQYANLAFGVTTIHDPSNDNEAIFSMAELQRTGATVAPRIFSTGRILYGALYPGATAKINRYEDAEFHVRRLQELGAVSVKSYNYLRRDQRQQVLEAARRLGMLVVPEGGMRFESNLSHVVDGHTGIEHAVPVAHLYDDVLQLWGQTDVGYSPTFGVAYGGLWGEEYWYDRTEVWRNEHLLRFIPRSVLYPRSIRRRTAPDEHYNHVFVAAAAKALNERGVPVVIGAHGQLPGLAAHWEMWMMEQGGFSPFEALRGATIDGARYLGMDAEIGSIEAGKLADLFVVDGDPLDDLRRSEHVRLVVLNGRVYDAATLNQLAPDPVARRPFYFEEPGGDVWRGDTAAELDAFGAEHGWQHRH